MTTCCILEKKNILLLQLAKNCKSISSKLRPQQEVKNVSSNKNTLYNEIQCVFMIYEKWGWLTSIIDIHVRHASTLTLFHQTPIPEPFPLLSSNLGRSLYQAFLCAMFPCLSVKYCLLFVMTKSTLFLKSLWCDLS